MSMETRFDQTAQCASGSDPKVPPREVIEAHRQWLRDGTVPLDYVHYILGHTPDVLPGHVGCSVYRPDR